MQDSGGQLQIISIGSYSPGVRQDTYIVANLEGKKGPPGNCGFQLVDRQLKVKSANGRKVMCFLTLVGLHVSWRGVAVAEHML